MFAHTLTRARLAVAALLLSTASARADTMTFDFNSISGTSNAAVQTYFNSRVSAASGAPLSITVLGASVQSSYTGEGYVVGPRTGNAVSPLTLGTGDGLSLHGGGFDSFLANSGSDRITITFSKPVTSVAFDWEIFPDGTGVWPDLTFAADGKVIKHWDGVVGPNGYLYSPNSLLAGGGPELNPQGIGTFSALFPDGVTKLEFIDWPRMIAIDNLTVGFGVQSSDVTTPEPATVLVWVLGLGTMGAVAAHRSRRAHAALVG